MKQSYALLLGTTALLGAFPAFHVEGATNPTPAVTSAAQAVQQDSKSSGVATPGPRASGVAQENSGAAAATKPSPPETRVAQQDTETKPKPPETAASQQGGGMETVVVTARRRSEDIQQVPVAVTAVSAKELDDKHIFEAFQLPEVAPSLQVESITKQVGAVNFSIRGVGTAVFGGQTESSVGVVIDDVVYSRPTMAVFDLFDLNQVEVLRGPQGTLFGKNAPAGLVSIRTEDPVIGELSGYLHDSLGFAHDATAGLEEHAQGALNIPISNDSAARISVFFTRQDGFSKDIFNNYDLGLTEYGARLKYLWQPINALTINLAADYVNENGPSGSLLIRRQAAPGGFDAAQDAKAGITPGPNNLNIASDAPTTYAFRAGGAHARINYEFDNGMALTNIIAYRGYQDHGRLDSDLDPINFANQNENHRNYRQISEELRLSSPAEDRFSYQVGIYYLDLKTDEKNNYGVDVEPLFPPPPPAFKWTLGGSTDALAHNTSYAAFGESQFKIVPGLNLTTGLRYTHDEVNYHYVVTNTDSAAPIFALGNLYQHQSASNLSYRTGLNYDVTSDIMAYFTFSRGYKGPTFDQSSAAPVKKETAQSEELGVKSMLFDRSLRLNVALFNTNFIGYQAQVQNPNVVGQFITLNAGSLRTTGAEAEFEASPVEGLTLTGGVTFNDAQYRRFSGVPCYFGQPSGTSGTNVCLPSGTTNVTGDQLQNASKWNFSFTPRYQHDVLGQIGYVQGDFTYRSSYYLTSVPDPVGRISGYGIFGGSVGLMAPDGHEEVSLFVRNLFDKRVPTYVLADTLSTITGDDKKGGNYWQSFGTMSFRTIGISASYRF